MDLLGLFFPDARRAIAGYPTSSFTALTTTTL